MLYVIVIHPVERIEIPIMELILQIRFFFFTVVQGISPMIYTTIILTGCITSTYNTNISNLIIFNNLNFMFLTIYNPTFL